jgi:hypothetical protein
MLFCVCTHLREERHNWIGQCLDCRCGHESGELLTQKQITEIFDLALGDRREKDRDDKRT